MICDKEGDFPVAKIRTDKEILTSSRISAPGEFYFSPGGTLCF